MQPAIIVDLDGTLADATARLHHIQPAPGDKKHWDLFNAESTNDPVIGWCLDLVKGYNSLGYKIIFLTARSESRGTRKITEEWLAREVGPYVHNYDLIMRDTRDYRVDFVTKQELYYKFVLGHYDVKLAIDDKQSVCMMWRSLGIPALHCSDY